MSYRKFLICGLCAIVIVSALSSCNDNGNATESDSGNITVTEREENGSAEDCGSEENSETEEDVMTKLKFVHVNGGYEVSKYTGTASVVKIPSTYENEPVISIGDSSFRGRSKLKTIEIPERATYPSLHPQNNYYAL